MSVTVRSYAKINLGLRIGPPRPDGFHELHTLYQTIDLYDTLTLTVQRASASQVTMQCSDPCVPTDSRNTAFRTVELALSQMGIAAKVHLHLQKNLPVQGGLGAGSANAAAALLGLEHELGESLPASQRMALAEKIGSDVPLFLVGGTVYGHNRGQVVLPYPDLPEMHCVVFAPVVGSSTPLAFRAWDERVSALTPEAAHDRLSELSRVYASAFAPSGADGLGGETSEAAGDTTGATGAFGTPGAGENDASASGLRRSESLAGNPLPALVRAGIANDFEEVVFEQHPYLRDILHALRGDEAVSEENRAVMAALSGSGSSLFGLYRTAEDAEAAQRRTAVFAGRVFHTTTLNRGSYWGSMFARGE